MATKEATGTAGRGGPTGGIVGGGGGIVRGGGEGVGGSGGEGEADGELRSCGTEQDNAENETDGKLLTS